MKRTAEYYLNLPYTFVIIPDDECYFIKVKELVGCMSQGDTIEDAYHMIKDAMNSWLEIAIKEEDKIPLPDSMQEVNYSGKISLRMPKSLHKKVAKEAKKEGVSLNSYIVTCIAERNTINSISYNIAEISNHSSVIYTGVVNQKWIKGTTNQPMKTIKPDYNFIVQSKNDYIKLEEIQ